MLSIASLDQWRANLSAPCLNPCMVPSCQSKKFWNRIPDPVFFIKQLFPPWFLTLLNHSHHPLEIHHLPVDHHAIPACTVGVAFIAQGKRITSTAKSYVSTPETWFYFISLLGKMLLLKLWIWHAEMAPRCFPCRFSDVILDFPDGDSPFDKNR